MAYRRRHGAHRSLTFIDDLRSSSSSSLVGDDAPSPSLSSLPSPVLAPQATRASAVHRDSSSISTAYGESAHRDPNSKYLRRSATYTEPKSTVTYEYTSMRSLNESKYGFWGVLARKAKSILEDGNTSQQTEDHGGNRRHVFDSSAGSQCDQSQHSPVSNRKTEGPVLNRGSEFASSLHQIGGTIKSALEEGLTIMENRTADIIQETRKLHIRRKSTSSLGQNNAADLSAPNYLYPIQNDYETQLKASRDVANAMAAKAKLLLRELKTVKADLSFSKERCFQLEEENKLLRESRDKGDNLEDDDLIRLQLETLLDEKGRLAHENSLYARENRFLREIVEYHQLTMQDVVYVDEAIEEVSEVCPIQIPSHLSYNPAPGHLSPIISRPGSSNNSENTSPRSFNAEDDVDTTDTLITTAFPTSPTSPSSPLSPQVVLETEEETSLNSPPKT